MLKNQKGFTLIELLIVIVIIGILAGVLISLIDPTRAQNRARDAGIQASINKIVLATEGYLSSFGSVPDDVQFYNGFKPGTITDVGPSCAGSDYECIFTVQGNTLSETCFSSWSGNGSAQCNYRYYSACNPGLGTGCQDYQIFAKSSGLSGKMYVYDSTAGGEIQVCDSDGVSNCAPL